MSKFIQSIVWSGGVNTGDEWDWIGSSLAESPRQTRNKSTNENRLSGTVIFWVSDRGIGFIKPSVAGKPDVFIHKAVLRQCGIESLMCGERVTYEEQAGRKGKPEAVNIEAAL